MGGGEIPQNRVHGRHSKVLGVGVGEATSAMNSHLTFRQVDLELTLRYLCEDAN